jgi:beta-aspartyl-peptidase (threonine type)
VSLPDTDWTLMVHGGAGVIAPDRITPEQEAGARAGLAAAMEAGAAVLRAGGAAINAVEAAVCVLEDDPHFNAGRGAALTSEGTIELDAAIMDGATRAAGAVAGVNRTRHPVKLARAVLMDSRHVLLAGAAADAFGQAHELEAADPAWFETPERRRNLDELLARNADAFDVDMKYGTVGAVARDAQGHLAAATSTGGVTGKRPGRIGDSPIIGAGTFADDRACAVSCTGSGEFFLRIGVAHEIAARVRLAGDELGAAADTTLAEVTALGGSGGVITVGRNGDPVWRFTTPGMYRGRISADSPPIVALYGDA